MSEDGGVLIEHGFWTPEACARIRRAMDRGRMEAAEVYEEGFAVSAARRSFDVDVDQTTLAWIDRALLPARALAGDFFSLDLRASEGAGLLRYPPGGFYGPHRDVLPRAAGDWQRHISLVIFLNSSGNEAGDGGSFGGGELRLYRDVPDHEQNLLVIVPRCGTLVAFPARCLHEVLPVTRGTRDAVVDWFA